MDYREEFQAKVRAALAEYEDYAGKEDPTEAFMDLVIRAADTWAHEYGEARFQEGAATGMEW